MNRKVKKSGMDMLLLIAVLCIVLIGILTIFSSSSFYGKEKYGDAMIFFKKHMVKVFSGLIPACRLIVASKRSAPTSLMVINE